MALPLGSTLEARVYGALLQAGWKADQIEAQYSIRGGRQEMGGQVVDFVLYMPDPMPIMVNGEWWHRNSEEEFLAEADVREWFGKDPIVIWGDEADTPEEAYEVVARKIGRGA